jgi:hypothetical protein
MTPRTPAEALVIPDSLLAKEATDVLREYSTDLLFNHSIRVYLLRRSRVARGSCASTLSSSTWPPRSTIPA